MKHEMNLLIDWLSAGADRVMLLHGERKVEVKHVRRNMLKPPFWSVELADNVESCQAHVYEFPTALQLALDWVQETESEPLEDA